MYNITDLSSFLFYQNYFMSLNERFLFLVLIGFWLLAIFGALITFPIVYEIEQNKILNIFFTIVFIIGLLLEIIGCIGSIKANCELEKVKNEWRTYNVSNTNRNL